jgi:ABC-type sugar transport system substrate-binding protein
MEEIHMYCSRCGQPMDPESRFCEHCGAPAEENPVHTPPTGSSQPPVSPVPSQTEPAPNTTFSSRADNSPPPPEPPAGKRKKANVPAIVLGIACVLLAAAFALSALGVTDAVFSPRKTFTTPEAAIQYFIDCVKAGDYEGAMAACAVDEIAEGYDYEALVERLQAMMLSIPYLPAEYELYGAYNESSFETQILRQLAYMAMSVTLPDEYSGLLDGLPLYGESLDSGDVVEDMNPEDFFEIEIVDIGQNERADGDAYLDSMEKQAKIYGAEDMTAYDVLYDIGGDYYAGGITLLQYEDGWRILSLSDVLLNQPVTGALIPLDSKSDFDTLLRTGEAPQGIDEATATEAATTVEASAMPAEPSEERVALSIGISLVGMDSGWAALVSEDIAAVAEEYDHEVTITYADWDAAAQVEQIETLITQGVDVIAVWAFSDSEYTNVVTEAMEAGIFVVMLDTSEPVTPDGVGAVSLGFDNAVFAEALTEWMYDHLGSNLSIAEISGPAGYETTDVFSSALSSAAAAHPGWQIAVSQPTSYTIESALDIASNIIAAYPDIDVFYCHTQDLALGAAQAVEAAGLSGQVSIVCTGSSQDIIDAVADGTVAAVALYDLHYGDPLMKIINDFAQGESLTARYYIGPLIIDESNAADMGNYSY